MSGDPAENVGWRAPISASTSGEGEFSTDAGAPAERDYPQDGPARPQDGSVSRETGSGDVSRETRPTWQVRTAGDIAEQGDSFHDAGTPLAQAAQHSVLRQGIARTMPSRRCVCIARDTHRHNPPRVPRICAAVKQKSPSVRTPWFLLYTFACVMVCCTRINAAWYLYPRASFMRVHVGQSTADKCVALGYGYVEKR